MTTYGELKSQLSDLNYLYPFSEDSMPLIRAMLQDLVSTVTSYKALETEHEITKEELRLAVEELNRMGSIVRERNQLQLQLAKTRDEVDVRSSQERQRTVAAEEQALRLELLVSQLRYDNGQVEKENSELRSRMQQILVCGEQSSPHEIHIAGSLVLPNHLGEESEVGQTRQGPEIAALKTEIKELETVTESLRKELRLVTRKYKDLESKFLEQSPVTQSGTFVGVGGTADSKQLSDKLDFVNARYEELKLLHSKCRTPTEKYHEMEEEMKNMANGDLVVQLKQEAVKSKREIESLNKELKRTSNELKTKEKELRAIRGGDSRKLAGQVALLEDKLRQVTEDRDELIQKLDEIDRSIQSMESEILKIESENAELKREKIAKEEAFLGISKQLQEVNAILNSLTDDMHGSEENERLKFRIAQLEKELKLREIETEKNRSKGDLEGLVRSLTAAKDQAVAGMKTLQLELNEARSKLETKRDFESDVGRLKSALAKLDGDRDDLQRLCDEQAEKLDFLRIDNSEKIRQLTEVSRSLTSVTHEHDRLKQLLEERDGQLRRLNYLSVDVERKEVQIRSLQAELANANRETLEVTKDNQILSNELVRVRNNLMSISHNQAELDTVMESLRITERERNDVVSLYRQIADENRAIGANLDRLVLDKARFEELARSKETELMKAAQANQQLVAQCRQAELEIAGLRAKIFNTSPDTNKVATLEAEIAALNEQIKDLVGLVELERSKTKLLSLEPPKTGSGLAELERTIEQQYILIGEMDAEQAKLILENTRLREQLHASS